MHFRPRSDLTVIGVEFGPGDAKVASDMDTDSPLSLSMMCAVVRIGRTSNFGEALTDRSVESLEAVRSLHSLCSGI